MRRTEFKRAVAVVHAIRAERVRVLPAPRPPDLPRGVHALADGGHDPVPKDEPVRSEGYRRWIASLPCFGCGIEGFSQCAHPNQGRGLGQKATDADCFPLCCTRPGHMGCHVMHDQLIDIDLQTRREVEDGFTAQAQAMARASTDPKVLAVLREVGLLP